MSSHSTNIHQTADIKYRPDIDGLRAVAVLSVVLHHAWPKWLVSGFIGVDIFFVISGFLISSIILKQLEKGRFSIADFYSRRVRRIFPALLVVLIATLAFGWGTLLRDEFMQIGKHIAAGGGFISNLVLWQEAGYFDNSASTKPLLHLWSLGVEEQFYFVWPLILWLVFRRKLNFVWVMAIIFCLSMGLNVASSISDPTAAYFSPLTRFWELMSGGAAAYWQLHCKPLSMRNKQIASAGGTLALAVGFALIKPQNPFPSWWALLPVAGAVLLIIAGPAGIINRLVLSHKSAVWIGLISYPLYLWHWPLLSYAYIIDGEKPSYQLKLALVAAAIVLAYLTYKLVEIPLREVRSKPLVIKSLTSGMAVIVVIGLLIQAGQIRERIDAHGADIYLDALNDSNFPGETFTPFKHRNVLFQKIAGRPDRLTVFIGDSVVQQYGPYIEKLMATDKSKYSSIIFATGGGCAPVPGTVRLPVIRFPLCPTTIEAAYDIANQPNVDTVVIGAAWYGYFSDTNQELLFEDDKNKIAFPDQRAQLLAYASLNKSIAELRKRGKRVFLVLQPPSGGVYDPRNMYTGSRFDHIYPIKNIENLQLDTFQKRNRKPREQLSKIANDLGAEIIDPADYLCKSNACPVLDAKGEPAYTDAIHMRPKYSLTAAQYLEQTLLPPPETKPFSIGVK